MEYSAGSVCKLFWYIETKETVKLLKDNDIDDVKSLVVSNNLYQQKSEERLKREFNAIRERIMSLPESIRFMITDSDINTSKPVFLLKKRKLMTHLNIVTLKKKQRLRLYQMD